MAAHGPTMPAERMHAMLSIPRLHTGLPAPRCLPANHTARPTAPNLLMPLATAHLMHPLHPCCPTPPTPPATRTAPPAAHGWPKLAPHSSPPVAAPCLARCGSRAGNNVHAQLLQTLKAVDGAVRRPGGKAMHCTCLGGRRRRDARGTAARVGPRLKLTRWPPPAAHRAPAAAGSAQMPSAACGSAPAARHRTALQAKGGGVMPACGVERRQGASGYRRGGHGGGTAPVQEAAHSRVPTSCHMWLSIIPKKAPAPWSTKRLQAATSPEATAAFRAALYCSRCSCWPPTPAISSRSIGTVFVYSPGSTPDLRCSK